MSQKQEATHAHKDPRGRAWATTHFFPFSTRKCLTFSRAQKVTEYIMWNILKERYKRKFPQGCRQHRPSLLLPVTPSMLGTWPFAQRPQDFLPTGDQFSFTVCSTFFFFLSILRGVPLLAYTYHFFFQYIARQSSWLSRAFFWPFPCATRRKKKTRPAWFQFKGTHVAHKQFQGALLYRFTKK